MATRNLYLHETVDTDGRTGDRRSDFDEVYGDWAAIEDHARDIGRRSSEAELAVVARLDDDVRAGLALSADDPAALAAEPVVVRRLQRQRQSRRSAIASRSA